ncbi:MAG: hypothetical protein WBB45_13460 [Cyclobacteriaceae bacterium]
MGLNLNIPAQTDVKRSSEPATEFLDDVTGNYVRVYRMRLKGETVYMPIESVSEENLSKKRNPAYETLLP